MSHSNNHPKITRLDAALDFLRSRGWTSGEIATAFSGISLDEQIELAERHMEAIHDEEIEAAEVAGLRMVDAQDEEREEDDPYYDARSYELPARERYTRGA